MKKESLKTKSPLSEENKSKSTSLRTFDLLTLIEKMKHEHTWEKGELNVKILLKNPQKQIVLTALHEGSKIRSFQSNDSVTFQIMEGKLNLHTRKESIDLDKGQLLTLDENMKYSLTTDEKTVFLLTIAKGNQQAAQK
jgi:quercetin dioxygenase-like cupin family protein